MARSLAPGIPHHVTQRGNRRRQTFFIKEDYHSYSELMSDTKKQSQTQDTK